MKMKIIFILIMLVSPAFASTKNYVTIYDVDGVTQTNRPTTMGRAFVQGEIATCPQPVTGVTVTSGSASGGTPSVDYQADVKNRWPDGSVKLAIISFKVTIAANSSTNVSFQNNASCVNSGYLTQAAMGTFNSSLWGARISVTPLGGTVVNTDATTMLAASDPASNTFGDCRNNYWLQGPIVTTVIVQDCTSVMTYDFGWTWNGTTMATPVTTTNTKASFHPMFILSFYPSINAVQVEAILEQPWWGKVQDQHVDIAFKKDATPATVWSHIGARKLTDVVANNGSATITSATASFVSTDAGLPIVVCVIGGCGGDVHQSTIKSVTNSTTAVMQTAYGGANGTGLTSYINLNFRDTRHRKVYWSGTAPGKIRIDHNFSYLKSTLAFPNYDSSVAVSTSTNDSGNYATSYSTWSAGDKGDIGGSGGVFGTVQNLSSNGEGALLQREDLLYLYNMGSCGTANGECAKAWQMLTGESGAIDTSLTANDVAGGGGMWNAIGNINFHLRESRTVATGQQTGTNSFYCPTFASKDALNNSTTCGSGVGTATGKPVSRHAHSDSQILLGGGDVAVASTLTAPWSSLGCDHWQDFAYVPYLLTGSYYFLEEEYFAASYCAASINSGTAPYQSNGFFSYINEPGVARSTVWGMQTIGRAAFIAPDSSVEATYYNSILNSHLEILEGILAKTGTSLTPSSTNPTCGSYSGAATNRWDFGRCGEASQIGNGGSGVLSNPLRHTTLGACPINTALMADTTTSAHNSSWQYWQFNVALSHIRELGFTNSSTVSSELHKMLEEQVLDNTFNPYLISTYTGPAKSGNSSVNCNSNTSDPYFQSYASVKAAYLVGIRSVANFNDNNGLGQFACADHGYSLIARAAGSFLQYFGTSSADANCPSGTCTAATTWTWLNAEVPYFTNTPANSTTTCTSSGDVQIKYALAPRIVSGTRTIGHTLGGGHFVQ